MDIENTNVTSDRKTEDETKEVLEDMASYIFHALEHGEDLSTVLNTVNHDTFYLTHPSNLEAPRSKGYSEFVEVVSIT